MNTTSSRRDHIAELLNRRPELAPIAADIRKAADMFLECFRSGRATFSPTVIESNNAAD